MEDSEDLEGIWVQHSVVEHERETADERSTDI